MDTRLHAVGYECHDNLHDCSCREQASEGMGARADESASMASLDSGECSMGAIANESSPLGCIRQKPSKMEQMIFEKSIWDAFNQCFLTHEEAIHAINKHRDGLLHN